MYLCVLLHFHDQIFLSLLKRYTRGLPPNSSCVHLCSRMNPRVDHLYAKKVTRKNQLQWAHLIVITSGHTIAINWMIIINKWASTFIRFERVIWDLLTWINLIPLTDWYHYPWSYWAAPTLPETINILTLDFWRIDALQQDRLQRILKAERSRESHSDAVAVGIQTDPSSVRSSKTIFFH